MLDDHDMDGIFQALAHVSRRQMLDRVRAHPGITVGKLASGFDVSRIAVMKHLRVLEEARLVVSQKDGRARRLYFNPVPIQMIHDRWMSEYSAFWSGNLTRIKYRAEARAGEPEATHKNGGNAK